MENCRKGEVFDMNIIYQCWNCKKEYKEGDFEYKNGAKCKCGGYIVSPSGKVQMKVIENNSATESVGTVEHKEITFRVYKMNDCDTVISCLSKEATNKWYQKECDADDEEQPIDGIKELELSNGFWSESDIGEVTNCINSLEERKEIKVKRLSGSLFIWTTFEEVILNMQDCQEPFVVCSTEY